MNEEFIDNEGDDSDIRDSSNGRDNIDYTPDIPPIPVLIEWRPESSRNVTLTIETPFEPLHNPNSLINHDSIINDTENEPIMMEDNPDRRPRVIELFLGQMFYDKGHFHYAL